MFGEDIVKANAEAAGSLMVYARPENESLELNNKLKQQNLETPE
jgi:hypothetical protein